jgi:uncharacterized protein YggE
MRKILFCLVFVATSLGVAHAADRIVSVTGEATVNAAPDSAVIRMGVSTQAATAREASSANAQKMTALFAALKDAGIAEKDIQTAWLSLQPQYETGRPGAPRVVGFQASNQLNVKVRDVKALPSLLDRAISAGATDVSGTEFVVSDQSKLLDQAREQAIADARRKAELYVKAAGGRVGQVIAIAEDNAAPSPRAMSGAFRAAATPVAVGEQTLHVTVGVTYAVE